MPAEIVLVRHGETTANAAGRWQGMADADLTAAGRVQVKSLATRLEEEPFTVVVSSDLGRAVATAEAAGLRAEIDPRWREMHIGVWEGSTTEEIQALHGDDLAAVRRGEDVRWGGGERFSEFRGRILEAFDSLAARLGDGERAAVVTHGGAIFTLVSHILGVSLRGKALRVTNAALTRISLTRWGPQVTVYNDLSHVPGEPLRTDGETTQLVLVRHGQTAANLEDRWQGHSDGELTAEGRRQADLVARRLPDVGAVYTSPLTRARDTARAVAATRHLDPVELAELKEIGFGSWESLTADEIEALDATTLSRLRNGEDIVRGGTGETFGGVRERMTAALDDISSRHPGAAVAVVSHGGALRAFVTGLLGMEFADRFRLGLLANTGISVVVRSPRGFQLGTWNLTRHLG